MTGTSPVPAKPRDGGIELFRWICIVAVLVHHSVSPRLSADSLAVVLTAKALSGWCVAGFIFVSGWLVRPDIFDFASIGQRARRLLVPFLGVNLVVCAILLTLIHSGLYLPRDHADWTVGNILHRMVYLQGMGPQFYFLPTLFLVGTACTGVSKWAGKNLAAIGWTLLFAVVCGFHGVPGSALGGDPDRLALYAMVFSLAMALRADPRKAWLLALVGAGLSLGVFLAFRGNATILYAFLPVPLFQGIRLLVRGRPLRKLSTWSSGSLYLWHAPIVHPVSMALWSRTGLPAALAVPLFLATTVVACQGIHLAVTRAKWNGWLSL